MLATDLILPAGAIILALVSLAAIYAVLKLRRANHARNLLVESFDAASRARQLIDPGGKVVFTNAAYRQIFQNPGVPLIDMLAARVPPESDSAELLRHIRATIAEGGRVRADIEILSQAGEKEWLDVSAQHLAGFKDHVFWGVEVVTTQRQIEEYIRSDHEIGRASCRERV